MTQEALKLALEALEKAKRQCQYHNIAPHLIYDEAITAIKEALAQEQEPVCKKDPQGCWNVRCQLGKKCKNTPPQRTWVDLTRTQMQDVYFAVLEEHRGGHQMEGQLAFGEALQAKIKERNT